MQMQQPQAPEQKPEDVYKASLSRFAAYANVESVTGAVGSVGTGFKGAYDYSEGYVPSNLKNVMGSPEPQQAYVPPPVYVPPVQT